MENTNQNMETVSFEDLLEQDNKEREQEKIQKAQEKKEKMFSAIMNRVQLVAKNCENELSPDSLDAVMGFLKDKPFTEGVSVFSRREPDESAIKVVSQNGVDVLIDFKPNEITDNWRKYAMAISFVKIKTQEEILGERKVRLEAWMIRKEIPCNDEICVIVDMHSDVQFHIFGKAAEFVKAIKPLMNEAGAFIGQEPDSKWRFIPNRPIGFVMGNEIFLSAPNWRWEKTDWTFFIERKA